MSEQNWTTAEVADLALAHPEYVATIAGRIVPTVTRAELAALAASCPRMFNGQPSQTSLTEGATEVDPAADAALARRYPTMRR
jgi:hypothetical protein